jgi:hypothetical protein
MPIFMQYEGIKGTVTYAGRGGSLGGIIVGNGSSGPHVKNSSGAGQGGVWKTTNFLAGGTASSKGGALVNVGGSNTLGGINIAVGDLDSAAPIEVSSISSPKSPAYSMVIDGRDANAANKARIMFETNRTGGTFTLAFNGQVSGAANQIRGLNNLRQIAVSGSTIPLIKILVGSGGNSNRVEIEMKDCLVSSWSNGVGASISLSINFTKVTYNITPVKD